ncbi:MAG: hypothetical protein JWO05_379 [Gemmatimonadetes bacterium]|nr:hypothetical protein [Gemmatimonadota bacterium]
MSSRAIRGWSLALVVAGCRSASIPPSTEPPAPVAAISGTLGAITPDELRRDLTAFADDSMRGRETGTPEAEKAAAFIAERARELGLEPAGDSMYLQRVPLVRERIGPNTRFEVRGGDGPVSLAVGREVVPFLNLGEGVPLPRLSADGDVVFVGYGISTSALKRDDFTGIDMSGKVVVMLHGAPANADSAQRAQLESQAEIGGRISRLLSRGPAAIILLMTPATKKTFDEFAPELMRTVVPAGGGVRSRTLPLVMIGMAVAGSPLLPRGYPSDDRAQALGRRFIGRVELLREPFVAHNVVAVLRGTDRALSRTYVAFGAHYDHIGVQSGMSPDSIANGADDDGSGTVALMAVARAMRSAPPRRSALFVWHVGEEKGLLGSAYFTDHPTVPIDSIVAQVNADMIGRNAPRDLYIVGPRAAPNGQSRVLGAIVDSVNAALAQPFTFNREWDSPTHPEQIYFRSDHYNYARKGIPIVYFTSGLHDDYHKVSDEVQKIDFVKLGFVSELIAKVGVALGNRGTRPR